MDVAMVTGSAGLVGSEAAKFLLEKGFTVIGIDNDMRKRFFGDNASTAWNRDRLKSNFPKYQHFDYDIRNESEMDNIFKEFGKDIKLILHLAAQPSHDWACKDPLTDFTVNANGTLLLLEKARKYCSSAVFIFSSTNKVYGDTPNRLKLIELESRWEIDAADSDHKEGIDESMSVDQTLHSLFGASKVAADILVQEYGRYFGMKTGVFRGGCITGPAHSGAELHGFLAYLMQCAITSEPYRIYGYKAKQVRDNIHSYDLVNAFWHFYQNPHAAEVYNIGGSRFSHCSMIEAIKKCEEITDKKINCHYDDKNRIGDHIWWVSNVSKFKSHYPTWDFKYDLEGIFLELYNGIKERIQ